MVLKNRGIVPGAWFKLCKYARHTDDYPEIEKYRHIQYILQHAVTGGNVFLTKSIAPGTKVRVMHQELRFDQDHKLQETDSAAAWFYVI